MKRGNKIPKPIKEVPEIEPRKFSKRHLTILILLIIFFIMTLLAFTLFREQSPSLLTEKLPDSLIKKTNTKLIAPENYVERVIDGDTFELASGEKVRLLCINAPEKDQKGYEESKAFLESMILEKEIKLLKSNHSNTDRYRRLLRYVYVNQTTGCSSCGTKTTKEIFINQEIVDKSYAEFEDYGDESCYDFFD